MNIMEKNLPIAESINEGDKLRIVTVDGNSKQIDVDALSANSERLLLGTFYGAFGDKCSETNILVFSGGGMLDSNKTLGEIIGNKIIVGYVGVVNFTYNDKEQKRESELCHVYMDTNGLTHECITLHQQDFLTKNSLTLNVIFFGLPTTSIYQITLYAICV